MNAFDCWVCFQVLEMTILNGLSFFRLYLKIELISKHTIFTHFGIDERMEHRNRWKAGEDCTSAGTEWARKMAGLGYVIGATSQPAGQLGLVP